MAGETREITKANKIFRNLDTVEVLQTKAMDLAQDPMEVVTVIMAGDCLNVHDEKSKIINCLLEKIKMYETIGFNLNNHLLSIILSSLRNLLEYLWRGLNDPLFIFPNYSISCSFWHILIINTICKFIFSLSNFVSNIKCSINNHKPPKILSIHKHSLSALLKGTLKEGKSMNNLLNPSISLSWWWANNCQRIPIKMMLRHSSSWSIQSRQTSMSLIKDSKLLACTFNYLKYVCKYLNQPLLSNFQKIFVANS